MKRWLIFGLIFTLILCAKIFADIILAPKPVTIIKDGFTWTRTKQSELSKRLEAGDRIYIIDTQGTKIPVQLKQIDTAKADTTFQLVNKDTQLAIEK